MPTRKPRRTTVHVSVTANSTAVISMMDLRRAILTGMASGSVMTIETVTGTIDAAIDGAVAIGIAMTTLEGPFSCDKPL
ncbi:MAG TPA: hypothetical protein VJ023_15655 [Pyrinomonadaceae bacterium]|nr:hypothetical protein [Pyrinomonadaceae bacterium]